MRDDRGRYVPRRGDQIDVRIVGATVADADDEVLFLAHGDWDSSTVILPLDLPGLTIYQGRCEICRHPDCDGHKMDCRHRDSDPTNAGHSTPIGDEPVKTITFADLVVGDIIRHHLEWGRVTRILRRQSLPNWIYLDVESVPSVDHVRPIRGETFAFPANALIDVPDGRDRVTTELVGSIPLPPTAEDRALVTAISAEASRLGAGVATAYERNEKTETPPVPTRNARIAAELRRRADQIEAIGVDLRETTLSIYCGAAIGPGAESERIAAELRRTIDELGLELTTDAGDVMRHLGASASSGGVTVRVSGHIAAPPPGTCANCGQTCGCGGVA